MDDERRWEEAGLTADEYQQIEKLLGRSPNSLELGMYGVMWSEHCSYKHSRAVLRRFPTEGEAVLQGPGENAGVVSIGDGKACAFKIESHNHPSAIEPYQGAATGVGGILRDIFAMGARPVASLNSLRFGPLDEDRVKYLCAGVVSGIGGYGNCVGVPTVGGEVYFSPAYRGNPLVNAMAVGLMEEEDLTRARAEAIGNPILLAGALTGRDGIQGASFASEELDEDSEKDRPAVQVGDPFREKQLLEATLEMIRRELVVAVQDLGAAGLTSSSCEMASKAENGIELDVRAVPRREKGMTPFEVMLSESQERMLVVPKRDKVEEVKEIFSRWGLQAAEIGRVTDDGLLSIKEGEQLVASIPARSLADEAPLYHPEAKKPSYLKEKQDFSSQEVEEPADLQEAFLKLISSPNLASREWVYRQYDHMVRNNTVVLPGGDAAVIRVKGTSRGLALTTDGNGRYVYLNPRRGGELLVAEAARNVTATGARPLAITDGLNFGSPENPEIFWQFKEAVEGIARGCERLKVPVVSGNVSFYNETGGKAIYPTPVVGMVGLLDNVERSATVDFKAKGDKIYLLGDERGELAASEYLSVIEGEVRGNPPAVNWKEELAVQGLCREAIKAGLLSSAHDCAEGGLAVALAEAAFSGGLGFSIELDSRLPAHRLLFGEEPSRFIVSTAPRRAKELEQLAKKRGITCSLLGEVRGDRLVFAPFFEVSFTESFEAWKGVLPCYLD